MLDSGNSSKLSISQALEQMKSDLGKRFNIKKVNLAELERLTGLSRHKLRRLKEHNFEEVAHGRTGMRSASTVLTGFTGAIDSMLKRGVKNSSIIFEKLTDIGYSGSLSIVKEYIQRHKYLVPAKRCLVAPQGSRGQRYRTEAGKCYQMDWGFLKAISEEEPNKAFRLACFTMICHHCGMRYVEFFPNALQENLFIGMIHAFEQLGIPEQVLTDNMASVVIRRDQDGHPIWNKNYEMFMKTVGFETKLCKPRHPFTKGSVERLVRFVKENFLAGISSFTDITDLNEKAANWCYKQNSTYHKSPNCVPQDTHKLLCIKPSRRLVMTKEIFAYLCPIRKISFDGFVSFEGRRFGVPYRYAQDNCRICRRNNKITIYSTDMNDMLVEHRVTWSRQDSFCTDQYAKPQPEEQPTAQIKTRILQKKPQPIPSGFEKFDFRRWK